MSSGDHMGKYLHETIFNWVLFQSIFFTVRIKYAYCSKFLKYSLKKCFQTPNYTIPKWLWLTLWSFSVQSLRAEVFASLKSDYILFVSCSLKLNVIAYATSQIRKTDFTKMILNRCILFHWLLNHSIKLNIIAYILSQIRKKNRLHRDDSE